MERDSGQVDLRLGVVDGGSLPSALYYFIINNIEHQMKAIMLEL